MSLDHVSIPLSLNLVCETSKALVIKLYISITPKARNLKGSGSAGEDGLRHSAIMTQMKQVSIKATISSHTLLLLYLQKRGQQPKGRSEHGCRTGPAIFIICRYPQNMYSANKCDRFQDNSTIHLSLS